MPIDLAICHAAKLLAPKYRTLPVLTRSSKTLIVSSIGVNHQTYEENKDQYILY